MQSPAEQFALLSTNSEKQHYINQPKSVELHTSSCDNLPRKRRRSILKRVFVPKDPKNLYKNLLLWVFLVGCLFLFACPLALHFSYALPTVKPRTIPLHEFSEERARDLFPMLTQHGPRVANTYADYRTRDFLITEIHRIRSSIENNIQFEINLQNFTSNFANNRSTVLSIDHLQNIAVRISNSNSSLPISSTNKPCLMMAAHYDSVELSPGGSDDGSGVVTLLELLSNLVHDPKITFTDVHLIVLFTTAEEMSLVGATEFVKNHTWKNDIQRFINLDSTGGNEKAILFRVKPSQLINDYVRVPRPHANVIGDEVLEIIKSDTDFRIFSENGLLPGYDFAFYLDGYSYHTRIDKPSIIEEGALQHLGENLLVLSRDILLGHVNIDQSEIFTDDNLIYFDVLGRHMIIYKMSTSIIIQSTLIGLIVLIGIFVIVIDHIWYHKTVSIGDLSSVYSYFKYPLLIRIFMIIFFFFCYLLTIIFGILFAIFMAFITSKIRPLSWFGNSTLAFFLYGLSFLLGIIICEIFWTLLRRYMLTKYPKKSPMEINTIFHINRSCFNFERHIALLLFFVLLMSLSMASGFRSLYFILLWSIFVCPTYAILILGESSFRWMRKECFKIYNEQGWYWLFVPYIVSLVPLVHTLEMTSRLTRLAIPMMGRMSVLIPLPQDIIICALIVVPASLFFVVFLPNMQRLMNYSRTLAIVLASFLIVFIVACTRQQFTITHPKLISVKHISQTVYRLNEPINSPIIIPIHSQNATITVTSLDGMSLSSTLDQISHKIGHELHNRKCSTKTMCIFDDTFNRTIAFKEVELTSMIDVNSYRFTFRHVSAYQINVETLFEEHFVVHNKTIKPRTETIVDIETVGLQSNFNILISIERCDLDESPFLLSLTEKSPNVVMFGRGRCSLIEDRLLLSVIPAYRHLIL